MNWLYLQDRMGLEYLSLVSTVTQLRTLLYRRTCVIALFLVSILLGRTYLTTYKTKAIGSNWHPNSVQPSSTFWKNLTSSPRAVQYCTSCPLISRPKPRQLQLNSTSSCPTYFKWIFEDLAPWRNTGISKNLILEGRTRDSFRVVIVDGRLFIEAHRPCFQTRAIFTVWGFAQLLQYYPGLVPDVDLLFGCNDTPVTSRNKRKSLPSPTFRYCSAPNFYDIPFPDWSFWGWPEINVRPWAEELRDIMNGSQHLKWIKRDPTAYWKGNPFVAPLRKELMKCNSSDFGAQLFTQDWISETATGFNHSKMSEQCRNRYKIYAEGRAWSVSLKYILACDSPVLLIHPKYHDFFIRGLIPRQTYWPVRYEKMCESIKFAVNWGNTHPKKVEAIGKAGQRFISEEVGMAQVYDYMLYVLTEYAKLLNYKPSVPRDAHEVCTDLILCLAPQSEKLFLQQSVVRKRSSSPPCGLDPVGSMSMRRMRT